MAEDTLSHEEHKIITGERYDIVKPKDSDILRGDGSFTATTDKNIEYTPKKGERYDTVRPVASDIWKVVICFIFLTC